MHPADLRIASKRFAGLDVAVTGRGVVGRDAEGDDLALFRRLRRLGAEAHEKLLVLEGVVGRQHRHDRPRVPGDREGGRGADRRGAVAPFGLEQDGRRLGLDLLELLGDPEPVFEIRDHDGRLEHLAVAGDDADDRLEGRPVADQGMNCFGMLSRDSGQIRVPDPPHMITEESSPLRPSEKPAPPRRRDPAEPFFEKAGARQSLSVYSFRAGGAPPSAGPNEDMANPAAARTPAKAPNAMGSEKPWAIAPSASGAGRRVSALTSEADDRPTAGRPGDWRAASAKPQGTIAPVPTPMAAKPATLVANPGRPPTSAKPSAASANEATMMRRSSTFRRMPSTLKRRAAWQRAKKDAPARRSPRASALRRAAAATTR